MYPDAIADFDVLLKDHPDYLPALKGAAEAHIGFANTLRAQNIYGRAKDHFQLAMGYLQRLLYYSCIHSYINDYLFNLQCFLATSYTGYGLVVATNSHCVHADSPVTSVLGQFGCCR